MSCSLAGAMQEINLHQESIAYKIYQKESVIEKYNCSFSLNENYRDKFERSNLQCVGTNVDGEVRIIEIPKHRYFLATLFQPQLNSSVTSHHPLIVAFLTAATWSSS